jgi:4-carboxymuconolactone decarboxylase
MGATAWAQDRMPPIPADKQSPAQKKSLELLAATPRGAAGAGGPFVPLLRSPELMNRLQAVGEYLRFHNTLPQKLVEMAILITANDWKQQYEWNVHYPLALKAGLTPETAAAIAARRHPSGMAEDEAAVYDFVTELLRNKSVHDAAYARLLRKFGEQGVVDATALVGYYSTLAGILNVAQTPK